MTVQIVRNAQEIETGGTGRSDPSAFIWGPPYSGLSRDRSQQGGKARVGFLKEKARGLWWGRGGVSLLFFWAGASGVQDVSQDNRLGEGRAVPW